MLPMQITYELDGNLYVNLTNLCSNHCSFCIRNNGDGVGSADNLWLAREPSEDEVVRDILKHDLAQYRELVFCGYGEPLERLETLLAVCRQVRAVSPVFIRINTNGQADLINGRPTAPLLKGLVDGVSISLNAADAASYDRLCASEYGEKAYDALLRFTADCVRLLPHVTLSVVDVIPPDEIEKCRAVARKLGADFRVRTLID
jgi:radical SAM enzyme (TIGR04100 family)